MISLWILALLSVAAWLYLLGFHGAFWRCGQVFIPTAHRMPEFWPAVAAIVPARDEVATIGPVLHSLLAQDYPGSFSVTLVDDRSTDGTAARASAAIAASGAGARAALLDGRPLPAGWAGKLWAQQQGIDHALARQPNIQFYFFCDADIVHRPETLRALVAKAETDRRDLVSLMVRLNCRSPWEKLLIPAFIFFFQKLYPFARANDDRSRTAAAAGGCVLIRRQALERIGGLAALRGALIDDCTLAMRVKRAGGRLWIGLTDTSRSLRVYDRLRPIWMMVARSAFTQLRYSAWLLAGTVLGMTLVYLVPLLLVVTFPLHGQPVPAAIGLAGMLLMAFAYRPTIAYFALPWTWALTLPAAALLYLAMTVDSARRYWFGLGSHWKGRDYGPRAEAAKRGS
ncbi:MAG TPA: glycosyltransferase [Dongiaceae bacterium]